MIIGICGQKGAGKTTAAKFLESEFGFKRDQYAKPLKEAAQKIFLLTQEQMYTHEGKTTVDERWGMTPREMFQQIGTDVVRNFDDGVWVKNMHYRNQNRDKLVIEDVRFPNESDYVRKHGGVVIGIKKGEMNTDDSHPSESEMYNNWDQMIDYTVINNGTKDDLYRKVRRIYKSLTTET